MSASAGSRNAKRWQYGLLHENGFVFARQAAGTHEIWRHPTLPGHVTVAGIDDRDVRATRNFQAQVRRILKGQGGLHNRS